jgi:hypothetical protein
MNDRLARMAEMIRDAVHGTLVITGVYQKSKMLMLSEPAYSFLKPKFNVKLNDDLIILYTKLVELGMERRGGEVYLAGLGYVFNVPE